jgi:hypothetical protein
MGLGGRGTSAEPMRGECGGKRRSWGNRGSRGHGLMPRCLASLRVWMIVELRAFSRRDALFERWVQCKPWEQILFFVAFGLCRNEP